MQVIVTYHEIEQQFAVATPPRAGSTSWYDACDLLAVGIKEQLRERHGRGFHVEVYGDEVGLILRVRGDGYGLGPWSVDRTLATDEPMGPQVADALRAVDAQVRRTYVRD
ncbi:MAG: hypothetical protein VXZ39_15395 [Planctomycetota bacterium]|nr:hypothetical protein [Planctomycetota bacterium]MEC8511965.1 hypothetical protein [Planctomycetota bacterium]